MRRDYPLRAGDSRRDRVGEVLRSPAVLEQELDFDPEEEQGRPRKQPQEDVRDPLGEPDGRVQRLVHASRPVRSEDDVPVGEAADGRTDEEPTGGVAVARVRELVRDDAHPLLRLERRDQGQAQPQDPLSAHAQDRPGRVVQIVDDEDVDRLRPDRFGDSV